MFGQIGTPEIVCDSRNEPMFYRWRVRHGNHNAAITISVVVFDRMDLETRRKVLKMQLVAAFTRMISDMINIV